VTRLQGKYVSAVDAMILQVIFGVDVAQMMVLGMYAMVASMV
jgi:hypothetical protein